jgi:hypothetical protein
MLNSKIPNREIVIDLTRGIFDVTRLFQYMTLKILSLKSKFCKITNSN